MIKINLLPHREAKRKQKQAAFVVLMALGAVLGVVVVLMVGAYNASRISIQEERNRVIANANAFARALAAEGHDVAGNPAVDFPATHQAIARAGHAVVGVAERRVAAHQPLALPA